MKVAGTMDEAAVVAHEMYLSYLRAGFTKDQALQITIAMMSASMVQAQGGGGSAAPQTD